jgi:hypothetical protein
MCEYDRRLLVSHRFICSLLDLSREKGFWFTGSKAWDCVKWNYGNVLISRRAISEWFSRPEISSYRFPAERLGGRRGSRAFVAEHVYPTRSLQALVLAKFSGKNPTEREIADLLFRFNRICYVWHEENEALDRAGFRSSMPKSADEGDVHGRYREIGIDPVETSFRNGPPLFKQLNRWRQERVSPGVAISRLAASNS